MTSSSSLYGTVTKENVNSTNSTSLYGEAGTPIPDANGNLIVRGDLWVLSGNILTTALTGNLFPTNATTINMGLAATAVNIGANTGTTNINNELNVVGNVTAPGADFGNITIGVATDNTITTTTGNLNLRSATSVLTVGPSTAISWAENSTRDNRLAFQSTNGTSTGIRVVPPVATGGTGIISVGTTNDKDNTQFVSFITSEGVTNPLFVSTGKYTAGVLGASGTSLAFIDGPSNLYATINPAGPTIGTDLTTKAYVDSQELNTTYTIDASTTTGGANFNLQGSDATTDTIKFANGTGITVSRTDANTITVTNAGVTSAVAGAGISVSSATGAVTIANTGVRSITGTTNQVIASASTGAVTLSLPQDIATTSSPTFAGATIDAIKIGITTANTIDTTSGGLTIAPATGIITVSAPTTVQWAENSNRLNRLQFQSSNGTSTGIRALAPVATGGISQFSAFTTNDSSNGSFINLATNQAGTNPLRITTGKYTAGVLGASGTSVAFIDNVTAYATVNPSGPTIGTDLTTKTYVDGLAPGGVTSVTGGTHVSASPTTGAVVVSTDATNLNTASTIVARDASGRFSSGPITVANYTLPTTDGTANQVIKTDGAGNLSFVTPASGTVNQLTNSPYTFALDSAGVLRTLNSSSPTFTTIKGGSFNQSNFVVDDGITTLTTIGGGAGPDSTVLTANNGSLTWAHTAGGFVIGSVSGTWSYNADGTTSFPNYKFPYADGTSNQVLRTNGAGVLSFYTPVDTNTTYTYTASTVSGGANLTLTGSDATTNTIKLTNAGHITAAYTSATEVTLGSDATNANTVSTIVARDASGNFSAGTVTANLADMSKVLGQLIATPTLAYTPPANPLTTVTSVNGLAVASSTGNSASVTVRYNSGDTTSGVNSAASVILGSASGTSTSPGGTATNQTLGTINIDGYTAGTSNAWSNTIATQNQGAGTSSITPLQIQGYARQAFTNSTSQPTTVTGASGTGSVATLTFTAQNTAPYVVGQTVAIAGMTPSGYNNAAAVITVATTSSISYANTTTGFTSGGTINAANTVTAAGTGFRVRGFASSVAMTVANRINFIDFTTSAATFKSAAYTFQNEVITGTTLTATNYMTLASTSHTIGNIDGVINIVRAGTTAGQRPVQAVRYTQTATAAPATGDGPTYRLQTAGSNGTVYNLAEIGSAYDSGGNTNITFGLANGDQSSGTMTVVFPVTSSLSSTTIKATASPTATPGGNTLNTVAVFDAAKITASVPIVFPNYTIAQAGAITGAVGWQIAINNSPVAAGRMAFWSTTATAGWRYVDSNLAI